MAPNEQKKKRKLSLSAWIIISLVVGLVVGLFFGEKVGFLEVIGTAFIKLLQMTILPYIVVSLIAGIARLTFDDAKFLAKKGGIWMLVIWAFGFAVMIAMTLAFPDWESGSYFSASLVEAKSAVNFIDLYIPSNPFFSLSNNIIPAVVLFSIAVGIALIGVKGKEKVVDIFNVFADSFMKVSAFIVKLTPIGVFAITASAAGTMGVAELGRLSVYFITFIVACLVLSFWVLPAMVAAFTPFKYKDVVWVTRDSLVLAFTTGNLFVVLPLLIEHGKKLLEEKAPAELKEKAGRYVDIIIPVYFNFPNMGKLILLLFVLFAAWFSGSALALKDMPAFVGTGLVSFFGSVDVAIPFLLDVFRIPADLFQLYMVTGVINGRFSTLLGAVNILAYTLITAGAMTGLVKISWRKLGIFLVVSAAVIFGTGLGTRLFIGAFLENPYTMDVEIVQKTLITEPVPVIVRSEVPETAPKRVFDANRLDLVRERGLLRVGYKPDNMPWTYRNFTGELVGLDIEMAHSLARDLDADLELIPFDDDNLKDLVDRGIIDIAMSGLMIVPQASSRVDFTDAYLDVTAAFVMPDHMRETFDDLETIQAARDLRIGVVGTGEMADRIRKSLPDAMIVELENEAEFFEGERDDIDALFTNAEAGSAWTVLLPEYHVAIIQPHLVQIPVGYVVPAGETEFLIFLNRWLGVNLKTGSFRQIYDHWVLGIVPESARDRRWSVMADVIGWNRSAEDE